MFSVVRIRIFDSELVNPFVLYQEAELPLDNLVANEYTEVPPDSTCKQKIQQDPAT